MNSLIESSISTFQIGGYQSLTELWHDKNVFCPNNKLYYVIDGEIEITIDKNKFIARKGDMVLIPAGTKHDFNLTKLNYAIKYWAHFDLKTNGVNYFENITLPFLINVGIDDYAVFLFTKMLERTSQTKRSDRLLIDSMISALVAFFLDRANLTETPSVPDEIDRVIMHVKNNYSEKFTLSTLAKIANLSPNYFVRKFKQRTGFSPLSYVTNLKIEKAKVMLEQSTQPVSIIMEQLGFYDSAHFSKLFKVSCGHSPRKYRDIYKNRAVKA